MKILFIDDEPRFMRSLVDEFVACGHTLQIVRDIQSASELIQNTDLIFDVVIVDMVMPSCDEESGDGRRTGLVLYREIRRVRPNQKIVILTNISDPSLKTEMLACEDASKFRFFRKVDLFPFEFVEEVQKFATDTPVPDAQC